MREKKIQEIMCYRRKLRSAKEHGTLGYKLKPLTRLSLAQIISYVTTSRHATVEAL